MNSDAVVEVRDLRAGYGSLEVLHGVSLTLHAGERVGLVGLNGHGKSTLLRAIAGLVVPTSGDILVNGRTIARHAPHQLARRGLALIPQGDELFPGLTVAENLDCGAYQRRAWKERGRRRDEVLSIFPALASRLTQAAGTLSGGERRMCAIGRGLMGGPVVQLVDEPSLGLAGAVADRIVSTLCQLDVDNAVLLMAEQNESLLAGRVDRLLRMHAGLLTEVSDWKGSAA